MIKAIATDASAAAIATTINAKKKPCNLSGYRKWLIAIKLMLTEFKINSIAINIVIRLRRTRKPNMPTKNIMVPNTKK